jgi:hypothetical protein
VLRAPVLRHTAPVVVAIPPYSYINIRAFIKVSTFATTQWLKKQSFYIWPAYYLNMAQSPKIAYIDENGKSVSPEYFLQPFLQQDFAVDRVQNPIKMILIVTYRSTFQRLNGKN